MRALFFAALAWTAVAVAQPSARPIQASEELEGFLEPREVVKIASQVPGILDEVLVRRGDIVKKGQVIARLKSAVERASVEFYRAKVAFGARKSARNEELARRRLVSEHEKDELDTDIELARRQLEEAQEKLNMRTIRATVDGVVTKRTHNPGEYVGEDEIVTIARIDPLDVEVIVPVALFGTVVRGQKAEVRPEAPVNGVHIATVSIVDQVVDAASATFGVRLEMPNPGLKLPAGLKCKVRFLR